MSQRSQLARIIADKRFDSLQVAMAYRAFGFCPIPIRPGTKIAACRWQRYQTERPDDSTLRRWFGRQPSKSIALVMGEASNGLVCRDFDCLESYHQWAAEYPDLAAALPTVATGRPGRHVYARASSEQIGSIGQAYVDLGDGELRLRACYCLAPPSIHPDGSVYELLIDFPNELPIMDLEEAGFLTGFGDATETTETTKDNGDNRSHRFSC